ncbi:hypothetical protein Emed_001084 [Eimeria media]
MQQQQQQQEQQQSRCRLPSVGSLGTIPTHTMSRYLLSSPFLSSLLPLLLLLLLQQQQQTAAFRVGPHPSTRGPELQQQVPQLLRPSASPQQQQQQQLSAAVVPQAASSSSSSSNNSSTAAAAATGTGTEPLLNGPLPVDLRGKTAFVAGVADSNGYGWAICKLLRAAGARVLVGTWPPVLSIFQKGLETKRFEPDSSYAQEPTSAAAAEIAEKMVDMQFAKTPLSLLLLLLLLLWVLLLLLLSLRLLLLLSVLLLLLAAGATLSLRAAEVPGCLNACMRACMHACMHVASNKRYAGVGGFSISEVAAAVQKDFGEIDILVHSLANGPEVTRPLLQTSRKGYLAAVSSSSYSFVSLMQHFLPIIKPGGSALALSYVASEKVIPAKLLLPAQCSSSSSSKEKDSSKQSGIMPRYGGGMSSAKAALESDCRVLAFEAGRAKGVRVNCISAGPLKSRAASAIGKTGDKTFIDLAIDYSKANAPLQRDLESDDVGRAALFLLSPLARAVTGETLYVDNGLHAMGQASDSKALSS